MIITEKQLIVLFETTKDSLVFYEKESGDPCLFAQLVIDKNMKKFTVQISGDFYATIRQIAAENEEEAREKALKKLYDIDNPLCIDYHKHVLSI